MVSFLGGFSPKVALSQSAKKGKKKKSKSGSKKKKTGLYSVSSYASARDTGSSIDTNPKF